jgi:two-component system phosphate regulon sensor histidine kinase PhoR
MQPRIRWKLILPYLVLFACIITIFSLLTGRYIQNKEFSRWQTHLLENAKLIGIEAKNLFEEEAGNTSFTQLAQSTSDILGLPVIFLDSNGAILGSYSQNNQLLEEIPSSPVFIQAKNHGEASKVDSEYISAAVAIRDNMGQVWGYIYLQAPREQYQTSVNRVYWQGLAILLTSTAGMILLAWIVEDTTLKPIAHLTLNTQQMTQGNFAHLDFPDVPQDLKALNLALQTMAEKLGNQIDTLSSEKAKLAAVLNQMTDGVLIANAEGRVELLNPSAERLFQINKKNCIGRSIVEVLRYHQLVELWRNTQKGERQTTTLEIGAQHLFLQVIGIPLKTGYAGNTLILFQDLTQLRRLQTVRRDFISNVSHELRTPLASLKALAETLQEGALEDPPAASRFLLRMETEIDNLTQLVNELLELSKIESGKVPLSFHRVQPCSLITNAYDRMTLQAERANLNLVIECDPNLPPVFADPDRITQVLINLIHNAIKFTPPGGNITLSAYQDNQQIIIFVRDTGVGIAQKDLGRIFERFYKADQSRTGGGTGLGLSIARHMIESHGGYIWAESQPEIGSTFYFSLPIA